MFDTLQNGSTPFHWAAANCHLEVVQALRAGHANIDAPDNVSSISFVYLC